MTAEASRWLIFSAPFNVLPVLVLLRDNISADSVQKMHWLGMPIRLSRTLMAPSVVFFKTYWLCLPVTLPFLYKWELSGNNSLFKCSQISLSPFSSPHPHPSLSLMIKASGLKVKWRRSLQPCHGLFSWTFPWRARLLWLVVVVVVVLTVIVGSRWWDRGPIYSDLGRYLDSTPLLMRVFGLYTTAHLPTPAWCGTSSLLLFVGWSGTSGR